MFVNQAEDYLECIMPHPPSIPSQSPVKNDESPLARKLIALATPALLPDFPSAANLTVRSRN